MRSFGSAFLLASGLQQLIGVVSMVWFTHPFPLNGPHRFMTTMAAALTTLLTAQHSFGNWRRDTTMTELNNPAYCEQFPLCEHLQKEVGDISAGLLMTALQMESESFCGQCPYYKSKH